VRPRTRIHRSAERGRRGFLSLLANKKPPAAPAPRNTAIQVERRASNIVDTPGHADSAAPKGVEAAVLRMSVGTPGSWCSVDPMPTERARCRQNALSSPKKGGGGGRFEIGLKPIGRGQQDTIEDGFGDSARPSTGVFDMFRLAGLGGQPTAQGSEPVPVNLRLGAPRGLRQSRKPGRTTPSAGP